MAQAPSAHTQRQQPYDLTVAERPHPHAPLPQARSHRDQPTERRADARPVSRAPSRRRRISGAVLSGVAGFVLGAVFWHLVGFWSFVSHIVLKGPEGEARTSNIETGSLPPVRREMRAKEAARGDAGKAKPVQAAAQPAPAPVTAAPATEPQPVLAQPVAAPEAVVAAPAALPVRTRPDRVEPPAPPAGFTVPPTAASLTVPAASQWSVQVDTHGR